ncbi:alpha-1,4-glucan--maltose-1-phosphate maltosyltransferase [Geomonas sp. Red32]|uniref:alpha-1,4-glucan--maltose-1-phosphate maltosyltransferase n=1 Tax=Geomonas sp. Red32 TaxID=2912856 RepID=UPI00202CED94|nr:alpha-1,4-glucan--maltose-1-phosphate maltosyltransferase [Geomonas sp. Red32]MCM0080753.1 alpha-1,4-glucan--maltose-1-phosphate maltosyltransferase [Geomonas sp. Red32]
MEGRERITIEGVSPLVDCGRYPVKRVAGDELVVEADIFGDGHDEVMAVLLYRREDEANWRETAMSRLDNDRWQGSFLLEEPGVYLYTLLGWVDHFRTWQKDLNKRFQAGQDVTVDILIGVNLLEQAAKEASPSDAARIAMVASTLKKEASHQQAILLGLDPELADLISTCCARRLATRYHQELSVRVDRKRALFSSWYELFPRSADGTSHGTLQDCIALLPEIETMGFDVLYLPPIHPIGKAKRKGRRNAVSAEPGDPGSPWAIGSSAGGHKSIHPELGTLDDFRQLVREAGGRGMEIALDIAFQCSPDHPYLKEHPEWFRWRPDGSVQYAENPPKKYQDIVPFNFECEKWQELWEELKSVIFYWMDLGINIFRVDNPHTKAFPFWEWVIARAKEKNAGVIFLAEAFTRPKVMYRLAKIGFTQSYTYFSWRNSRDELVGYLTELTRTEVREFMRPNFWPNTPDILPEFLQYSGRAGFMIRVALAATLSSNYGIYGPSYELCVAAAEPGSEEYQDAEKYEIRLWDREAPGNLKEFIARLNRIRRDNDPLQVTANVEFYPTGNGSVLYFGKLAADGKNTVLVVVNLDPFKSQQVSIRLPLHYFGVQPGQSYLVDDLLNEERFIWQGEENLIELDPQKAPARIFRIRTWQRRESNFDYYL